MPWAWQPAPANAMRPNVAWTGPSPAPRTWWSNCCSWHAWTGGAATASSESIWRNAPAKSFQALRRLRWPAASNWRSKHRTNSGSRSTCRPSSPCCRTLSTTPSGMAGTAATSWLNCTRTAMAGCCAWPTTGRASPKPIVSGFSSASGAGVSRRRRARAWAWPSCGKLQRGSAESCRSARAWAAGAAPSRCAGASRAAPASASAPTPAPQTPPPPPPRPPPRPRCALGAGARRRPPPAPDQLLGAPLLIQDLTRAIVAASRNGPPSGMREPAMLAPSSLRIR